MHTSQILVKLFCIVDEYSSSLNLWSNYSQIFVCQREFQSFPTYYNCEIIQTRLVCISLLITAVAGPVCIEELLQNTVVPFSTTLLCITLLLTLSPHTHNAYLQLNLCPLLERAVLGKHLQSMPLNFHNALIIPKLPRHSIPQLFLTLPWDPESETSQ